MSFIRSIKHRFMSSVPQDDPMLVTWKNRVFGGITTLVDDSSAQATGVGGVLTAKAKTSGAAICTFGGWPEELATAEEITLEGSGTALLPATNDAIVWVIAVRLSSDRDSVDLISVKSGLKNAPASQEECLAVDAPDGGYRAELVAQCASEDHCIILGTVQIKRTGDTAVAWASEHSWQVAQYCQAEPLMDGNAYFNKI